MSSTISFAPATTLITEGNSGASRAVFTVLRGGDTSGTAEARWAVSGQANAADFVGGALPSGFVTFAVGESSKTIEIDVAGDTQVESNENFTVSLSAPVGTVFLTQFAPTAVATIVNDDGAILSVASTSAFGYEGNATNGGVDLIITRSGDTSIEASASWTVSTSSFGFMSANANAADFVGGALPSGTVSFAAGQTSQVIRIETLADTTTEPTETFTLTLSNPSTGAVVLTASGSGLIVNDDGPTTLTLGGPTSAITEGNSGATNVTFTVTRTGDPTTAVSANWAVSSMAGMGISGWATGSDFVGGALPSGIVSFAAGEITKTITVSISGDTEVEVAESFGLALNSPDNSVAVVSAPGSLAIPNDDGAFLAIGASRAFPTSTFASLGVVNEGNAGTTEVSFVVTRSGDLTGTVSATWSVLGAPAGSFLPSANGADFVGGTLPSGIVSFGTGETSKIVTVQIQGDTQVEAEEYFSVQLSAPSSGVTLPAAFANSFAIRNDDAATVLSLDPGPVSQAEGNSGSTAFSFTVTRSGVTTTAASANWAITSASANAADFVGGALPSGTVSFANGETSKTITIEVAGDTSVELDESFTLTLAAPTGASFGIASATGTIQNDDVAPPATVISIAALSADKAEGRSGSTPFTFTVTRTGELGEASSANWAVTGRGGSPATAGDFAGAALPSGVVSFAAGEASKTITVSVRGDSVIEGDEGFSVTLSAPVNGALGEAAAQGTIRNDDAAVSLRPALERSTSFMALGTEDTLLNLDVAETRDGGFIVVWEFQDRAVAGGPILAQTSLAQRFDANGQAVSAAQTVFSVTASNFELRTASSPSVSVGTHGGSAIAWNALTVVSGSFGPTAIPANLITVQRNDAAGGLIGFTEVTAAGAEDRLLNLDVAAAADGGFLLAWEILDRNPGDIGFRAQTAYAQRFDASGAAMAPAQVITNVNASSFTVTHSSNPSVSLGADGGTVTAWNPLGIVGSINGPATASTNQIMVERRDASGDLRGVTSVTAGGVEDTVLGLDVAAGPDGGFTLTWELQDRPTGGGLILAQSSFAQRFDAAGQALGAAQLLSGTTASSFIVGLEISPSASMGPEGGVTLAWHPLGTFPGDFGPQTQSTGQIQVSSVKPAGTPSVLEGQAGSTSFSFLLTREGDTSLAASVNWAVRATGTTPVDGADFVGGVLPSGTLTFAAGETSRVITLDVQGDTALEANETFRILLSNPSSGLSLAGAALLGVIANDDAVAGTMAADRLLGSNYADLIRGQDGNDRIIGDDGNDTLEGQAGDDGLLGGLGADRMLGGIGDDTYHVDNGGDIVVELADEGSDRVLSSISYTLTAHVERLILSGTADINGTGSAQADRIEGNEGANLLSGAGGGDVLLGGGGADTLHGGAGRDLLNGGLGADRLEGGLDADRFVFSSALEAHGDVVADFSAAARDGIDLRPMDANILLDGDQAFTWLAGSIFTGAAGQLRFADGVLSGDVNGDSVADFEIALTSVTSLASTSFWL
jgi:hypothetical protein